jgi:hypothetical protein
METSIMAPMWTSNIHLERLTNLYFKPTLTPPVSTISATNKQSIGSKSGSIQSMIQSPAPVSKMDTDKHTFQFTWSGMGKQIPQTFSFEERTMLPNDSFIASMMYAMDTMFYISDDKKQRKDVDGVIECIRGSILRHSKITKEQAEIVKQLEQHVYSDKVIQYIIDYFQCMHCVILSRNPETAPTLFLVQKQRGVREWNTASQLLVLLYDEVRDSYRPIMPEENTETFWVSWRQSEFRKLIERPLLWNKPAELKKWPVAELREWIELFDLDIDIGLDKKKIVEVMEQRSIIRME